MKRRTFRITLDEVFGGDTLEAPSFFELCGEVARHEHGNCTDNTCEIPSLIEHGHYFAAVHHLAGASEFPAVDALYAKYSKSLTIRRCDKDSREWWEFVEPFSVKCHDCGAIVYGNPVDETFPDDTCASCWKRVGVESFIETFRDSVIESLLWATLVWDADGADVGNAEDYFDEGDIPSQKYDEIDQTCRAFVAQNWEILGHYQHEAHNLGHEYLVMAAHLDSGFFRYVSAEHGEALREKAKADSLPELHAYEGDDGEFYLD
ncbi:MULTISPECIES: hypothetical protein [unclassified Streptomyces]|uniref:hypothetical protein n=1 Tax=unclassified Streptomyces TaxID=2593676 RepID=UPI00036EEC09|nr:MULTISPECIES: hypothetical protein [unclassified Streptomyces]MYT31731.1 hypothetical protein [Streptomyces sp. SID8354]